MSTHNLCFVQKCEKYQRLFLFENFQFLEVKFSIYLNRHAFVMIFFFYFRESASHSNETREAPPTRLTSAWTEVTSSTVQQPSVTPSNNQGKLYIQNS